MPDVLGDHRMRPPVRTPSAGVSRYIQDETVLVDRARLVFGLLSVAVFVAVTVFATLWLRLPGRWEHPVPYVLVTLVLAYMITVWAGPGLAFERMQRELPRFGALTIIQVAQNIDADRFCSFGQIVQALHFRSVVVEIVIESRGPFHQRANRRIERESAFF